MISINDAVIHRPTFTKVAEFELPKDTEQWSEEILKQFYQQVGYLPKEVGVDVVLASVDDNEGYAKGSVVVWFNDKKLNFPIIVKKFILSPFDVFVKEVQGKPIYLPATEHNVKKMLSSDKMATLENIWAAQMQVLDYKTPGNIAPKMSIPLFDVPDDQMYNPYAKLASVWKRTARKEDLQKLAVQLQENTDVAQSFVDNTGDLMTNIVNLQNGAKETILDQQKSGPIDMNGVIRSKRVLTVLDSELVNPENFQPAVAPSVCELRLSEFPSMEKFLESGDALTRYLSTSVGSPITGVLLDCLGEEDIKRNGSSSIACCPSNSATDSNGKVQRNRRPQIFISACGKCYAYGDDYERTGVVFYTSGSIAVPGAVEKTLKVIESRTTNDFINQNSANRNDGSDKMFNPIKTLDQGKGDGYSCESSPGYESSWMKRLLIVYGSGDAWEALHISGNFRKFMINGSVVYVSSDTAFIPARIGSIQKVKTVENPIYKMAIGQSKNIYLYPEQAIVINTERMTSLTQGDFLTPSDDVRKKFEDAVKNTTQVKVASENGFHITGGAIKPLQKIAKLSDNTVYSPKHTIVVLTMLGMDKTAAEKSIKLAYDRFVSPSVKNKNVSIFGLTDDYVNPHAFDGIEKKARVNDIIKQVAYSLRKNLVKEASVIGDPEAVDTVLSLNFINEDNLGDFVNSIGDLKKVSSKLALLLVTSRMGLSDVDESAIKKAMEGLETVIEGLENVKTAIGK